MAMDEGQGMRSQGQKVGRGTVKTCKFPNKIGVSKIEKVGK
jgi:hypothetical protein